MNASEFQVFTGGRKWRNLTGAVRTEIDAKLRTDFPELTDFRPGFWQGLLETGEARNVLAARARGSVIVAMDDDDVYAPDYISYMVP